MTDRYQFAIEVAKSAGSILGEGYHQHKTIHLKGDRDLVTEFDLRSEEFEDALREPALDIEALDVNKDQVEDEDLQDLALLLEDSDIVDPS